MCEFSSEVYENHNTVYQRIEVLHLDVLLVSVLLKSESSCLCSEGLETNFTFAVTEEEILDRLRCKNSKVRALPKNLLPRRLGIV